MRTYLNIQRKRRRPLRGASGRRLPIYSFRAILSLLVIVGLVFAAALPTASAQKKSVKPGINDSFKKPDVKKFIERFERESREVYHLRHKIVCSCKLKPGMVVADIGAGTGLFARLFAKQVGPKGKVYAVDIAKEFLDHIDKTCKDANLNNVVTIQCDQFSSNLPPNAIDLVFICDTYHHFEFPYRTMESIHRALKPGGQIVMIDFKKIKGVTSDFIWNHVRAGQEVFTKEVTGSGFKQVQELNFLEENYFLRFLKVAKK